MYNEKEFIESCIDNGISHKKAKKAWHYLKGLRKSISENWQGFQEIKYITMQEKLRLRNFAAEQGVEITPDELDGLIDIIISIQDGMEEWKNVS